LSTFLKTWTTGRACMRLLLSGLLLVSGGPSYAIMVTSSEPGPKLTGARVVLPLVLVRGYPFVRGAINEHKGLLMFDIGNPDIFAVDSSHNFVSGGITTGRGFFGSGQAFTTVRYPTVKSFKLGGCCVFQNSSDVPGYPGALIERAITPAFIGWLGLKFFWGYIVRLDYAHQTVAFYRNDQAGLRRLAAVTKGEALEMIKLGDPSRPNIPTFLVRARGMRIVGNIDTGSRNELWLSTEQIKALEVKGVLKQQRGDDFLISGLTLDGHPLTTMTVDLNRDRKPPIAARVPIGDAPFLTLGYEFFSHYQVTLNYSQHTMTLAMQSR
jgi:hypothetical protein